MTKELPLAAYSARDLMRYIFMILALTISSILNKANSYMISLFDYRLIIYILVWIAVLISLHLMQSRFLKRKKFSWFVIYLGFFFLNFGSIQDFLEKDVNSQFLAGTWTLTALFLLIFMAVIIFYGGGAFVNSRRFYFLLAVFSTLSLYEISRALFTNSIVPFSVSPPALLAHRSFPDNKEAPDIYFLIFDSYTSKAILQKNWIYDNDSIREFLQQHDFRFTSSATSAYDFTPLSINSTLNMNFLQIHKGDIPRDLINFNYGRKIFGSALIPAWLKEHGYDTRSYSILSKSFNLDSTFPLTPDAPLHWMRRQTIERIWLTPSMWQRLLNIVGIKKEHPQKLITALETLKQFNRSLLDSIRTKKDSSRPLYLYAHFHLPHEPYMYYPDGTARPISQFISIKGESAKRLYLDQVRYANALIRQIVTDLWRDGKKNKIVIIQGDHGYREFPPTQRSDKLGIFNAIYFPDQDYKQIGDSAMAVNTFRIIFNKYFGQQLPMLQETRGK